MMTNHSNLSGAANIRNGTTKAQLVQRRESKAEPTRKTSQNIVKKKLWKLPASLFVRIHASFSETVTLNLKWRLRYWQYNAASAALHKVCVPSAVPENCTYLYKTHITKTSSMLPYAYSRLHRQARFRLLVFPNKSVKKSFQEGSPDLEG